MDAYAILGFFAVMGLVGWLAAGRRQRPTISPAWRKLAKRMGGSIRPARSDDEAGRPASSALRVAVEGVEIEAKLVELERETDVALHTSVTAEAQHDYGLELFVTRRGALAALERALGSEVLVTGDDDFDAECQVVSPTPPRALLWLDGRLRRAITASTSSRFSVAEGRVEALRLGRDDDERRMVAVITAVARLARRGKEIRQAWGRLAHRLDGTVAAQTKSWPDIEIDVDGVIVAVTVQEPAAGETVPCTRVATKPLGRQRERFAVARSLPLWSAGLEPMSVSDRSAVSANPSKTSACLERIATRLAATKPDSLTYDGEMLSLTFDGIVQDEARLRAAIALVASLGSRDEQGPYR